MWPTNAEVKQSFDGVDSRANKILRSIDSTTDGIFNPIPHA